ncbi:MAG: 3-deoxy-manno-octulosonate cytidylyltransferase [Oleiphilaceae bacterium]|nr:3-deoxy-manno-octulosonate cytidylyltransferase [Oleiphilaceae bacterium]
MEYTVIIPARYASSRLPGKPLVDIAGKPMIQRVYEQALASTATQVVIATDDARIAAACDAFGASAVMTSPEHPSGTDRLEEVVQKLDLDEDAIVVNVQGDEPLIPPEVIDQVARNLSEHADFGMATLCERIHDVEQVMNPNIVKVVFDRLGRANYFSRAPIPWAREAFRNRHDPHLPPRAEYYRHIGIYAYRVDLLKRFVVWSPSMTEQVERLEQLRVLSNGESIHIDVAQQSLPGGVDTPEDLERIRAHFAARG